jgi:hypothetical protein
MWHLRPRLSSFPVKIRPDRDASPAAFGEWRGITGEWARIGRRRGRVLGAENVGAQAIEDALLRL